MSFQYDFTLTELLEKMGYTKGGDKILNDQQKDITLPAVLRDFLSIAIHTNMFSTSDVWVRKRELIRTLYDDIEENIEDEKEYWEKDKNAARKSEYYRFYKLPKEQWKDIVPNYLLIGSDFSMGIIEFGICGTDLDQDDPPVSMHHENDSIRKWRPYTNSVSEFLMLVFCDALSCDMYDTVMDVLEKDGWDNKLLSKDEINRYAIDLNSVKKYPSFYDGNALLGCAYEEDSHTLLLIKFNETTGEIMGGVAYSKGKIS